MKRREERAGKTTARRRERKRWGRRLLAKRLAKIRRAAQNRGADRSRTRVPVKAPNCLDLRIDPHMAASYFRKLMRALDGRHGSVFVDLRDVTALGPECCAILRAIVDTAKRTRVQVEGNLPHAAGPQDLIDASGFLDTMHAAPPRKKRAKNGRMVERGAGNRVRSDLARDHARLAASIAWPALREPRHRASFQALVECMANTRNHASSEAGWWVATSSGAGTATVTFVDLGVGMLRSANVSQLRKHLRKWGIARETQVMRELFEGKIPSATDLPHRGKGLPFLRELCEEGRLRNMCVLSNQVFADISTARYVALKNQFEGTVLMWEVGDRYG